METKDDLSMADGTPDLGISVEARRTAATVADALFGQAEDVTIGRFAVLERCGAGAMGIVYAAWDPKLRRRVAIKLLKKRGDDAQAVLREARAAAKLSHPHIVTVYDASEDDGRAYVAMEFVDGVTLDVWLKDKPGRAEILRVFGQLALGLHAAHEGRLVHRDFKPGNALVAQREGRAHAFVVDFGLSVAAGDASAPYGGTPAYMAPEQQAWELPTPASDQYAFWVTFYEAFVGHRPETPAALDGLDRKLQRLVAKGLSADPAERFETMRAVHDALEGAGPRGHVWRATAALTALGCVAVAAGLSGTSVDCETQTEPWAAIVDPGPLLRELDAPDADASLGAARVDEAVGRYGLRWQDARRRVCRATFVEGAQSETRLDARMSCLDDRAHELQATLDALARTPEHARRAVTAVDGVTGPERCVRSDGELSPHVSEELEAQLRSLEAVLRIQDNPRALRLAEDLDGVAAVGSVAQRVRRFVLLSRAHERAGHPERAAVLLDGALKLAVENNDTRGASEVALEYLWQEGVRRRDLPAGRRWAELGHAWLQASGGDPLHAAMLYDRLGVVAGQAYDDRAAESLHRAALEQLEAQLGADAPQSLVPRVHLLGVLPRESPEARTLRASTLALATRTHGASHPVVAVALAAGRVDFGRPEPCAAALPDLRRALEIKVSNFGPDAMELVPTLDMLANCEAVTDDLPGSLEWSLRAVKIIENTMGSESPRLSLPLLNLSLTELLLERFVSAEAHIRTSLKLDAEALGPLHPRLAGHRLILGQALLGQGKLRRAAVELQRSLDLEDPTKTPAADRIETRLYLARCFDGSAVDRPRAVAVLDEALAIATAEHPASIPQVQAARAEFSAGAAAPAP